MAALGVSGKAWAGCRDCPAHAEKVKGYVLNHLWFWLPRVSGIVLVVFVSAFALDVFSEGNGFWKPLLALLIHLFPTATLAVALALAWRRERLGGLLFVALGLLYVGMFRGRADVIALLVIAAPTVFVGIALLGCRRVPHKAPVLCLKSGKGSVALKPQLP
jgi:hypothetical protein